MEPAVPLESLETFAFGLDHPEGICGTPGRSVYVGRRGGQSYRVGSNASRNFPNGLALAPDGARLYVLESLPGALAEIGIRQDGSAGGRTLLCELDPAVPDGVALAEDGGFYIACYRPDAVFRWHPE